MRKCGLNLTGICTHGQGDGGGDMSTQAWVRPTHACMASARPCLLQGTNGSPALGAKAGSVATYFHAPHPSPGRGITLSPDGRYVGRPCTGGTQAVRLCLTGPSH